MFVASLAIVAQMFAWVPPPPRDLPPASDAWWLPSYQECSNQLMFNTQFRMKLNEERKVWPWNWQPFFTEVTQETVWLRQVWIAARNADADGGENYTRYWLGELRDLIGDEDYDAGRMPPSVPTWRFRELRER